MSDFNRDYFEALLAMGWFEPSFADQFARNSAAHELLPASVQEKIRTTFFQVASEMSWAETARRHDDQLQQRVVDFFKQLNLLYAHTLVQERANSNSGKDTMSP